MGNLKWSFSLSFLIENLVQKNQRKNLKSKLIGLMLRPSEMD